MKKSELQQQPQIDLSQTTSVPNDSGGLLFKQGFVIRKVSRFITNGAEDAVLPIAAAIEVARDGEEDGSQTS